MQKSFLISFFILTTVVVFGQSNMQGDYVGQVYISDTDSIEIQLSLNCDKTFNMNFSKVGAIGKWAMTSSKILSLKADYSKIGCFGAKEKNTVKFSVEANKITWKGKTNTNYRRVQRDLMKSTGEKITVTRTDNETPTVLKKEKDFKCD